MIDADDDGDREQPHDSSPTEGVIEVRHQAVVRRREIDTPDRNVELARYHTGIGFIGALAVARQDQGNDPARRGDLAETRDHGEMSVAGDDHQLAAASAPRSCGADRTPHEFHLASR